MLRSLLFIFLVVLLGACANQLPVANPEVTAVQQETYHAQYDRSALKSLQWLAGEWKGKDAGRIVTQSFLFHTDHILEITPTEAGNQKASQFVIWKDGHYYFGQNRQWIVTWISEKNIRFDPLNSGLKPMTWSRVNENEWHLLRHNDEGDEVITMERTDGINS
ncbi:MAG: hypothetical protein Q7T20_17600 [Saprospiraceae bacterium]|nr:hypothetical protein [Saprospiraceae bacterium]